MEAAGEAGLVPAPSVVACRDGKAGIWGETLLYVVASHRLASPGRNKNHSGVKWETTGTGRQRRGGGLISGGPPPSLASPPPPGLRKSERAWGFCTSAPHSGGVTALPVRTS